MFVANRASCLEALLIMAKKIQKTPTSLGLGAAAHGPADKAAFEVYWKLDKLAKLASWQLHRCRMQRRGIDGDIGFQFQVTFSI